MRLEGYGLQVGAKADLIVVAGDTITHAVVARPQRRLVVKHGKVAARGGVCVRTSP
jgi:cytosine/adenosine deaminase-related metal-dependent hydrolase